MFCRHLLYCCKISLTMDKVQDGYKVAEIDFVVPNLQTAERIFLKGMGLKVGCRDVNGITFYLNKDTLLSCWLPKKGVGIWGRRIRLFTSTPKVLQIAKKLENGEDMVDL